MFAKCKQKFATNLKFANFIKNSYSQKATKELAQTRRLLSYGHTQQKQKTRSNPSIAYYCQDVGDKTTEMCSKMIAPPTISFERTKWSTFQIKTQN